MSLPHPLPFFFHFHVSSNMEQCYQKRSEPNIFSDFQIENLFFSAVFTQWLWIFFLFLRGSFSQIWSILLPRKSNPRLSGQTGYFLTILEKCCNYLCYKEKGMYKEGTTRISSYCNFFSVVVREPHTVFLETQSYKHMTKLALKPVCLI